MPEKRAELLAYSLDVTTVGKVPGWPELFSENASELWVSAHPIVVLTSQSCQGTERYASARDPPSFSRTGPLGHGTIGPGLLVEAEAGRVNRAGPARQKKVPPALSSSWPTGALPDGRQDQPVA
jgi:hypothetical protein